MSNDLPFGIGLTLVPTATDIFLVCWDELWWSGISEEVIFLLRVIFCQP